MCDVDCELTAPWISVNCLLIAGLMPDSIKSFFLVMAMLGGGQETHTIDSIVITDGTIKRWSLKNQLNAWEI